MISKPGVYKISSIEYHADPTPKPSLSRSVICDLLYKSPAHAKFRHPRLNPHFKPDDGGGKFDIGSAAHSLLLEGVDNVAVIDADDWRGKAAKEARDEARAEGKTPLLRAQYENALKMVVVAMNSIVECEELKIDSLINDGDAELSYIWKECRFLGSERCIWMKVRPDWISKDKKLIIDYKTTSGSANPNDLARRIIDMGYDIQAALYGRGVKVIEGTEPAFVFVFQETEEPYFCSFVSLPPEFVAMGKSKVEFGTAIWDTCLCTGKWSAYPNKVAWIDPPSWSLAAWESLATSIGI